MAARRNLKQRWVELTVVVPALEEKSTSLVIQDQFGSWPVSYSEPESNLTRLTVFLPETQKLTRECLSALRAGLKAFVKSKASTALPKVYLKPLVNRDWKNSWKSHFRPLEVGSRLLLRPSWSRQKAKPGQRVVVLDPGLSFGTGHHPTTSFCLRATVQARSPGTSQSFLDIGTGSGILAIAAAKLGYQPVNAFDYDPDSVRVALTNAKRNRVDQRIKVIRADLRQLPVRSRTRYDVVCVNILADILMAESRRLINRVKPNGMLVIAGILAREFDEVDRHFTLLGARLLRRRTEGEWTSGAYRIPA